MYLAQASQGLDKSTIRKAKTQMLQKLSVQTTIINSGVVSESEKEKYA
jgi:hypothetical protein